MSEPFRCKFQVNRPENDFTSPFISLANPDLDIAWVSNPDEIIIDMPTIRILYEYPFSTSGSSKLEHDVDGWIFEAFAPNGHSFTRADLALAISEQYHKIYAEEAEKTTIPVGMIPGMYNRVRTDGPYGIWGHVLEDLLLHTVAYHSDNDYFILGIDS